MSSRRPAKELRAKASRPFGALRSGVPRALVALSAAAIAFTSSLAHADIYRYTDQDGVIHFSNVSKHGQLVDRHTDTTQRGATNIRETTTQPAPALYDAYIREAARLYQ